MVPKSEHNSCHGLENCVRFGPTCVHGTIWRRGETKTGSFPDGTEQNRWIAHVQALWEPKRKVWPRGELTSPETIGQSIRTRAASEGLITMCIRTLPGTRTLGQTMCHVLREYSRPKQWEHCDAHAFAAAMTLPWFICQDVRGYVTRKSIRIVLHMLP